MLVTLLMACSGGKKKAAGEEADAAEGAVPEYVVLDNPQVDIADFQVDDEGYIVIFNGKDFTGWRGYGKEHVPTKWTIEDGAIKFNGSGGGEAQDGDGGDIIFAYKFKNFELQFEWKVDKGSNSGVFYLAQEVQTKDPTSGEMRMEPIYISAPEAQILDNENHPDAKLGKNNNRQSMSLYDMIPAVPQNSNRLASGTAVPSWFTREPLCTGKTVRTCLNITSGRNSGPICFRPVSSAKRPGLWRLNC